MKDISTKKNMHSLPLKAVNYQNLTLFKPVFRINDSEFCDMFVVDFLPLYVVCLNLITF